MAGMEKYIIQFDSCTCMMKALGRFLHGKDFAGVGVVPHVPVQAARLLNAVPKRLRESLYRWSGWKDALPSGELKNLKEEDISRWTAGQYPEKKYPALFFGSSNGAAIHLAAALEIPWLPQTYLVAARRSLHADDIRRDMEWGEKVMRPFIDQNPSFMVHQMHDPLQDRLMITKMGYFRLKRRKLGADFEDFILNRLEKSGTLFSIECRFSWPACRIQDRHYFQIGGFGGIGPYEYLEGGPHVEAFLKKVKAQVRRWDAFEPSGEFPEAEWGFDDSLLEDAARFAARHGYHLRRILFDHPEGFSGFVADLYRWWYTRRKRECSRLLIENFALIEPYWALWAGCIPLWLAFNTESSYQKAKKYIEATTPWDEIYLMLMSNGVEEGIGLTPVLEWKKLITASSRFSDLLGVDQSRYPLDFGNFIQYHYDLKRNLKGRREPYHPLTLEELETFISRYGNRYDVRFQDDGDTTAGRPVSQSPSAA